MKNVNLKKQAIRLAKVCAVISAFTLLPKLLLAEKRKNTPTVEDDALTELESVVAEEKSKPSGVTSEDSSNDVLKDLSQIDNEESSSSGKKQSSAKASTEDDPMLFLNDTKEQEIVPVKPKLADKEITLAVPPPKATETRNAPSRVISESSLLNEDNIYSGNAVYTGKPIELLELKDTDIRDALRLIGKYSGYNIVIGEDVSGKIGILSLTKVPWDQAFSLILQSKKLGYTKEGNVLRIATLATLKAEKEEAAAAEQSKMRVEPLKTMLIPISYAKASELSPRAKSLLSDRGSIDVDDRSNTIMVRDIDKVLQRAKKLFTALDMQPPRVSITAKVMEMSEFLTRKFGFNVMNFNLHPTSGVSFDQTFVPSSLEGRSVLVKAENFANLEASFQLSEIDRQVKVLASPTISVNQNSKGTIRQNVSFIRLIQGGTVNGQQQPAQFQSVNAELILEATPVVASDGTISITMHVKNDVPSPDFGSGGNNGSVDTRDINTSLLLNSGDTAVIGGIFKNTVSTATSGVPLLMDIPILGFLFSSRSKEVERSEILIFLTAKITNADEVFKKTL